jgi:hypothetical protein
VLASALVILDGESGVCGVASSALPFARVGVTGMREAVSPGTQAVGLGPFIDAIFKRYG